MIWILRAVFSLRLTHVGSGLQCTIFLSYGFICLIWNAFGLDFSIWLLLFQNDHQAVDILLAEIDVYELFAFKHCKGRKVKLALCEGAYINAALFSCTLFVNSFSLVSKKDSVQLPRHFLELLFRDFVCLSSFCLRFTCPRTWWKNAGFKDRAPVIWRRGIWWDS